MNAPLIVEHCIFNRLDSHIGIFLLVLGIVLRMKAIHLGIMNQAIQNTMGIRPILQAAPFYLGDALVRDPDITRGNLR